MKKPSFLLLFIIAITTLHCNSQDQSKGFDYGQVLDGKYVNSYFDVEITLPPGWIVQSREQLEALTKTGQELVAGDDSQLKAFLKASEINVANLLAVYQFEHGSPVEYNPSILLVAENVKNSPGIKKGSDYLFHARNLLEQSQLKYDHLDKEFKKQVISSVEFYTLNASITYMNLNIRQIYYSTVLNGFTFNVIISFVNEEQKLELMKSVNSMKFKK